VLLNAGAAVAVALGFALIALWLCLVLRRLGVLGGSDGGTDGEGWGGWADEPSRPEPPSDDLDLWPELERELLAYLETHERAPVAG
jgi:hypothetical protein